ncbi:MAG TPA: acyl-CoA thioesterase [Flavobacteriaceae bacterium]|nr:acyl-CoA thioesterase [Flavobacteriaceae bacterium]
MTPIPFQCRASVPKSAIDRFGHVNNVFYLKLVQQVAEKHWRQKTPVEIRKKLGWVVLDHFVEYKKPAHEKEILLLKTWIESHGNVKCVRFTEILRDEDDGTTTLIAKAKTTWCIMDLVYFRPTRITAELTEPYFE